MLNSLHPAKYSTTMMRSPESRLTNYHPTAQYPCQGTQRAIPLFQKKGLGRVLADMASPKWRKSSYYSLELKQKD